MEDLTAVTPAPVGLSQIERVADTFTAPSKTFTDVLRSTSWWLPFLLIVLFAASTAFAVDQKIGFDTVAEQTMQQNSAASERMAQLTPEARAHQIHAIGAVTRISTYAAGVFVLIFAAIAALLNWGTINFGFGGKTTFGQNMAVQMYASLPLGIKYLLTAGLVMAGVGTENFDARNPVGTNLAYYLPDAATWLKTLLTFFDLFGLWTLVLGVIGLAIISRKSKSTAAVVVVGWWLLTVIVITGITAATGS